MPGILKVLRAPAGAGVVAVGVVVASGAEAPGVVVVGVVAPGTGVVGVVAAGAVVVGTVVGGVVGAAAGTVTVAGAGVGSGSSSSATSANAIPAASAASTRNVARTGSRQLGGGWTRVRAASPHSRHHA